MPIARILLAEDNDADVALVREALAAHEVQYHLHVVADGDEAKRYIHTLGTAGGAPCPDVMLLDLNLPKRNGHEVLQILKQHPECSHVPVVIVTSSNSPKDRRVSEELGAARYFRKPLDFEEFLELGAVVRELLPSGY